MLTPLQAFTDYKLSAIDAYIDWEKNKLSEAKAVTTARKCVETILKTIIIWKFRDVHYTFTKPRRGLSDMVVDVYVTEFNRNVLSGLKKELDQNPKHVRLKREHPYLQNFVDFNFTLCSELTKEYFKGLENEILYVKDAGDDYAHESKILSNQEIERIDVALQRILDCFFQDNWFGVAEHHWREIYVQPRKLEIFRELARGIARESVVLQEVGRSTDIERVKEKYFKYIEIECGQIQFDGLSGVLKSGKAKATLENSYVPLGLVENNGVRIYSWSDRMKVIDLIKTKNRLLVLADPGSGKSTLLKSLAVSCAFPERGAALIGEWNEESLFPIYIRCRDLKERAFYSITEIICKIPTWAEMHLDNPDLFSALVMTKINSGSALILIDGMDEISGNAERMQFIIQVLRFTATHPNVKCIITSRDGGIYGPDGSMPLADQFDVFRIAPLSDEEKGLLSDKWHRIIISDVETALAESKRAVNEISQDSIVSDLAENPLILTALLLVRYRNEKLPKDRATLYKETIKFLIDVWNIEAHGHILLDYEETEIQLAYLAYWMTKNDKQTITEEELRKKLKESRSLIDDRKFDFSISDFVRRVEMRTGLLRKTGSGEYEFAHLNFQEFLATIAIIKHDQSEVNSKKCLHDILLTTLDKDKEGLHLNLISLCSQTERDAFTEYLLEQAKTVNDDDRDRMFKFDELVNVKESDDRSIVEKAKQDLIAMCGLDMTTDEFETLYSNYESDSELTKLVEDKFEVMFSLIRKFRAVEYLGKYIANGINLNDALVARVPGVFINGFMRKPEIVSMNQTLSLILKSKSKKAFDDHIRAFFKGTTHDDYIGKIIFFITTENYNMDLASVDYDLKAFFTEIKSKILSPDKATSCIALIQLVFDYPMLLPELAGMVDHSNGRTLEVAQGELRTELNSVCLQLREKIPLSDPHYYCIWASCLFDFYNIYDFEIPEENFKIYWNGWFDCISNNRQDYYRYYSALVLSRMIYPDRDIAFLNDIPKIEELLIRTYEDPKSYRADKLVAAYLGIMLGIEWELDSLRKLFRGANNTPMRRMFSEKVGLDIQ